MAAEFKLLVLVEVELASEQSEEPEFELKGARHLQTRPLQFDVQYSIERYSVILPNVYNIM